MQASYLDWFYQQAAVYGYPERILGVDNYTPILESCGISETRRILDVGCGAGALLKALKGKGWAVGADTCNASVLSARHYGPGVQARGEKLPFRAESFDRVVYIKSLSLMDWKEATSEAQRVLKRGGLLVIAEQEGGWWDLAMDQIRDKLADRGVPTLSCAFRDSNSPAVRFSWRELVSFLENIGFLIGALRNLQVVSTYPSLKALAERLALYSPLAVLVYKNLVSREEMLDAVSQVVEDLVIWETTLSNVFKALSAQKT